MEEKKIEDLSTPLARKNTPWFVFWTVVLSHFLLSLLIQIENYFAYVYHIDDGIIDAFLFVIKLPFIQLEPLIFALLLGGFYFLIHSKILLRWGYACLVVVVNLLIIMDQLVYKIFFDHFRLSFADDAIYGNPYSSATGFLESLGVFIFSMADSALAEMSVFFLINIVAVFGFIWLCYSYQEYLSHLKMKRPSLAAQFFVVMYVGINLGVVLFTENNNLNHHPLFTLMESSIFSPAREGPPEVKRLSNLYQPPYGTWKESSEEKKKLQEVAQIISSRPKKPNIILITLESVGSLQILRDGKFSPQVTPYLATLSPHTVIFQNIYSSFPGTIRSHMAFNTGGRTITWGSVHVDAHYKYKGPTLVKELQKLGYQTAVFSAQNLDFEDMTTFYKNLGFHKFFHFGDAPKSFQEGKWIHSWGADEEAVLDLSLQWIDQMRGKENPFFLHYLTVATHHPYGVSKGFKGPLPYKGNDSWEKYYNSLYYTSEVLGNFLKELEKRKLMENTLVILTGDHGEAFGVRHRKNYTHKNYLYDENVKIFFAIIDKGKIQKGPILSKRVAAVGDLMPSILALLKAPAPSDVPGQNLFSPQYALKTAYFYKLAYPEQWGLQDGKWKFITQNNKKYFELYDLEEDPKEQVNLADQYPDRVDHYFNLCASWIIEANDEFRKRLEGYEIVGGKEFEMKDLFLPGPKIMAIGTFKCQKERKIRKDFVELKKLNPMEKIWIWGRWYSYEDKKSVAYLFEDPDGNPYWFNFAMDPGWALTWYDPPLKSPLKPGLWKLSLYDGPKKLLFTSFEVDPQAPLLVKAKELKIQALEVGVGGKNIFQKKEIFSSNESIRAKVSLEKINAPHTLLYRCTSPTLAVQEFIHEHLTPQTAFSLSLPKPLEKGRWKMSVWTEEEKEIGSVEWEVK